MNAEDKTSIPGYIYFRDNERDYKIGLTNNLVVRGRAYKTENPRDTVVDFFSVETYAEAEAIEAEMKRAARAEGLCSFDNSDEWLERTKKTKAFWNRFAEKYARKTKAEWASWVKNSNSTQEQAKQEQAKRIVGWDELKSQNRQFWEKEDFISNDTVWKTTAIIHS